MNDHELTVLVEAAASGAVNSRASVHGGPDWDAMDAGSKNSVREHALPFIYHGTKALADLGYTKPRTITTAEERAALKPGTICVDALGNAWKRGTGSWVGTGDASGALWDDVNLEMTVLYEPRQS